MARVLGVVRLSRSTDESTSVVRQREEVARWAARERHEVIGWAEDLDVSGAVDPFVRPGLGPWLTSRTADFDILCAWRLDRVSRSQLHVQQLAAWLQQHGKRLVSASEGLDTEAPGAGGSIHLAITGALAQAERESMSVRAKASTAHLLAIGQWRGGALPFGYRAEEMRGGGKQLVIVPEMQAVAVELYRRTLAGDNIASLCQWLNDTGTLTASDAQRERRGQELQGIRWHPGNLRRMLTNPALMGLSTHEVDTGSGKEVRVVRGPDGQPVQRAEPLLTAQQYARLQEVLTTTRGPRHGPKHPTALLRGLLVCSEHGFPMYRGNGSRAYRSDDPARMAMYGGRESGRYRCSRMQRAGEPCPRPSVREDDADDAALRLFFARTMGTPVVERIYFPGNGVAEQRAEVARAVAELVGDRSAGAYSSEVVRRAYDDRLTALDREATRLGALPVVEDRWDLIETGETYPRAGFDEQDVVRDMRAIGVRFTDKPSDTPSAGALPLTMVLPEDYAARLSARLAEGEPTR